MSETKFFCPECCAAVTPGKTSGASSLRIKSVLKLRAYTFSVVQSNRAPLPGLATGRGRECDRFVLRGLLATGDFNAQVRQWQGERRGQRLDRHAEQRIASLHF